MLSEFGEAVGIPELTFDDDGCCCLSFDDAVVNFELDDETGLLYLYADVGAVPDPPDTALYEMLLEADYLHRETAGGTLGIDKAAGVVALVYQIPYDILELSQFETILDNFINMVEHWTDRIGEFHAGEEAESNPHETEPPGGLRA